MKDDVLSHPMRRWSRTIVGETRMSGPQMDQLYDDIHENMPTSNRETAEAALALGLGALEGVVVASGRFTREQIDKATPKDLPQFVERTGIGRSTFRVLTYGARTAESAPKEAGKFLAIAGLASPADPEATEAQIDQVVTMARANAARIEIRNKHAIAAPDLDEIAKMGTALLGLNSGPDQIKEVRVIAHEDDAHTFELHAFDAAGYHVFDIEVYMAEPGVMHIDTLQASHGRNCEKLLMAFGGSSVPGRGNAAAIAAGLEALVVEGAKAGLHKIRTTPGSPQVMRLYEKMGFTSPGDDRPWRRKLVAWTAEKLPVVSGLFTAASLLAESFKQDGRSQHMVLDLEHDDAVRQALVGFRLARAAFSDVPKNVAQRMEALGQTPTPPSQATYAEEFPEGPNVRVLRI